MNVNSNSYTYLFSVIMVVLVAVMLSVAALSLKPAQDANIELEKKQEILKSLGVEVSREEAGGAFDEFIKEQIVLKGGQPVANPEVPAFAISMADAVAKPSDQREGPLFIAERDGQTFYIIPVRGKGLWGPIWGYVSISSDGYTVTGATFGHKGETPGLGAEISTPVFTDQFPGKKLAVNGAYQGIAVRKGDASGDHQVDGISGGTITSVGVENMLNDCLQPYIAYLLSRSASSAPAEAAAATSDTLISAL
jgi:Na+-transporting NADH:ubiquinone oxidoreductase subunit C